MHSILVRARLHRPPFSSSFLQRPDLIQRLYDGLNAKVTLISAPAGFGKSTLISSWLDQIEASSTDPDRGASLRVSWLSLEESDNQLPRFVRYLVAAIEEAYPQSCEQVIALLFDKTPSTIEALTDLLANTLTLLPGQLVLVLDDLHTIHDEAIYTFLTRLIQHTSQRLHLVFITRLDPPLPLSRWRAQGLLNELRLRDLSFTLEETTEFLRRNLEYIPTAEIVSTLHEGTEGWVVGLRLVALALRGVTEYSTLVSGFESNSNRYVIDYLMDDVLEQQSPSLQQFLICTAILPRFSPALCAAILEISEGVAQQHINYVARANLFLIELSTPVQWYRYHHQFQTMLLSRLHERYDPQAIAQMHRQAADWLAEHQQIDEALHHLLAIPDHPAIADLIESQWMVAINEHRVHELEEWLSLVPVPLLNQRPILLISLGWVQDHRLDFSQCLITLQRAEALLQTQGATLSEVERNLLQANMIALRISADKTAKMNDTLDAIHLSWKLIRPHLSHTHCMVVVWLALGSHRLEGGDLALEMLQSALEQSADWPHMARARLLYSSGIVHWYKCHLALAERAFQRGLHLARQHNLRLATTLCNFGLSLVANGRNQQEQAETFHLEVIREPHYQNGLRAVLSTFSLIGIYAGRGEPQVAAPFVERLKNHAILAGRPYLQNQVAALEAYLSLVCGNLPAALHWALAGSQTEMYSSSDRIPIIRAIIFLAEASRPSLLEAKQMLEVVNRRHEHEHDWAMGIDASVLYVLTLDKLGQRQSALEELGKIVRLCVPNGLIGPFIEQNQALKPLLLELGKKPDYAQLVLLLLTSFPRQQTMTIANEPSEELVESLTERELEILHLLADRLSNKEIAQRLVVSANTVRNHTANIFSKLQVENRFQAVERAQTVGLLPAPRHPL